MPRDSVSQSASSTSSMGTNERHLAALARDRYQVFTMQCAISCGLTADQVRARVDAGDYLRLHRGVYTYASAPQSFGRSLTAALLAGGPTARGTGPTAAHVLELPGGRPDPIEITCHRWRRTHRDDALVVHERLRTRKGDVREFGGFRISRPELVVIELMHRCGPLVGERAYHEARRRRLISHGSMIEVFLGHARRGTPGIAGTRALLDRYEDVGAPTESPRETMLLQALRAAGLPEPVRQLEVRDRLGGLIGRADFGYPDEMVTLEYHSRDWHSTPEAVEADERRRNAMLAAGWIPVIARRDDLVERRGREVIAALRRVLSDRRSNARRPAA
jgi:hypothetical protein